MKKMKRLVSIGLFFLFLFLPFSLWAADEFETAYTVRYEVLPTGVTHVNQNISLTNKLSNVYATRYSLILQAGRIENITASDDEGPLQIEIEKSNQQTKIDLTFNQQVAGKDKVLNFNLAYDAHDLATKTGQVWGVTVPKLSDPSQIDSYNLTLAVPQNFGQLAFISPNPVSQAQEDRLLVYRFTKSQLAASGIHAAFGQFQVFDFVLSYHLQNPRLTPGQTEIALPPDTAYQRVFYEKLNPRPENVTLDADGNWLATYKLKGNEKLDVTAVGKVKIFSQAQEDFFIPTTETLAKNLLSQPYWPVDDPLIQEKAKGLKTPKQVYDFVVDTLEYDFNRVKEEIERLGALKALENPETAICMEFTDLFVTLARAAGIPAREINGYAYTTNPQLRPLSLVADILHSWPEYWDEEKQTWIPVDPTWEKTTGGLDYFSRVDLNHFVFTIHGQNSKEPYPAGSYKTNEELTKDVQVVFGEYETETPYQLEVAFNLPKEIFFELKSGGEVVVKNNGPSAVYNLPLNLEATALTLNDPTETVITILPPFGQEEIPVSLSAQLFKFGEGSLTASLNSQQFNQSIKLRSLVLERVLPLVVLVALLTFIFLRVKKKREVK